MYDSERATMAFVPDQIADRSVVVNKRQGDT